MYRISTQLAKAVFNIGDFFYRDNPTESIQIENGIITYTVGKSSFDKPVDSFFFMCKDWALEQKVCLLTGIEEHTPNSFTYVCFQSNKYRPDPQNRLKNPLVKHKIQTPTIYGNNEKQCLIDVCQWIIDKGV